MNELEVLKRYWGYDGFRPLQDDIIRSVLEGNDTLALLPTGGGKSICFQVPAMVKEGICIVISPLVALMKDQVESLKAKGINAVAIYAGMGKREIDILLDNCIYGNIKFLYLSPERLMSELVRIRISYMNVNLIAIDEAHCISQWGYDFRPPYLKVNEIRELHPEVPVLALTATATRFVRNDIAADFYHAGIEKEERFRKQEAWKLNRIRVMVATNAFGMGIDKPDVRFVVHLDLPDSLEAYYQEAGRAGRDLQKAYTVLLANKTDEVSLKAKYVDSFPSVHRKLN